MLYKQLVELYDTRAKSRDFKTMYHRAMELRVDEHGVCQLVRYRWEHDNSTGKGAYKKCPFARVTPDDVIEFLSNITATDNQGKNCVTHLLGSGYVESDKSRFGRYENRIRFIHGGVNVPFSAGFKFCLRRRIVLEHQVDVKLVSNRERSKPVLDYVQRVLHIMEVLERLGDLTRETAEKTPWRDRRLALSKCASFEMTEDNLVQHATAAYVETHYYVGTFKIAMSMWVQGQGAISHPLTPDMQRAAHKKKFYAKAAEKLRAHLKTYNNAYDKEVIQPEKSIS